MRELLLVHSVNNAPWKVIIFQPFDIGNLADFIVDNYFRHYSIYKYCFTPKIDLDIMLKEEENSNNSETVTSQIHSDVSEDFEVLMKKCAEMKLQMKKVEIEKQLESDLVTVKNAIENKIKELTTPVKGKK